MTRALLPFSHAVVACSRESSHEVPGSAASAPLGPEEARWLLEGTADERLGMARVVFTIVAQRAPVPELSCVGGRLRRLAGAHR